MNRLAFSSNAFKTVSLEDAARAIADAGYRGIEVMADVPHAYPAEFGSEARIRLKELLRKLNLTVSNVNAFTLFARGDTYHPTWIEHDPKLRELRIEHTIQAIELAEELGAPTVSLQPGGPLIGMNITPAEASRRFAAGLNRVLEFARREEITLAIEPEPGLLIQTTDEFLSFKHEFFANEPLIRMNCDIGHLFCVGEDPAESIRRCREHIAHVHLEDIGKNRVHQHLPPGKGVIDFQSIFAALRDIDYTGWVTVELYPYESSAAEAAKRAIEYLSR